MLPIKTCHNIHVHWESETQPMITHWLTLYFLSSPVPNWIWARRCYASTRARILCFILACTTQPTNLTWWPPPVCFLRSAGSRMEDCPVLDIGEVYPGYRVQSWSRSPVHSQTVRPVLCKYYCSTTLGLYRYMMAKTMFNRCKTQQVNDTFTLDVSKMVSHVQKYISPINN